MIEEQFVSFDTARMLKEVGFNIPCRGIYVTDRTGYYEFREYDNKQTTDNLWWNTEDGFQYEYLAPIQALAARWLHEVHRIVVDVAYIPPHVGRDVWQYFVGGMDDMVWPGDYEPSDRKYETYEEAMEVGLQEAIKLIKSKDCNEEN